MNHAICRAIGVRTPCRGAESSDALHRTGRSSRCSFVPHTSATECAWPGAWLAPVAR